MSRDSAWIESCWPASDAPDEWVNHKYRCGSADLYWPPRNPDRLLDDPTVLKHRARALNALLGVLGQADSAGRVLLAQFRGIIHALEIGLRVAWRAGRPVGGISTFRTTRPGTDSCTQCRQNGFAQFHCA